MCCAKKICLHVYFREKIVYKINAVLLQDFQLEKSLDLKLDKTDL